MVVFFQYRGPKFRCLYSQIVELRSFLSAETPILALTATATQSVYETVRKNLCMKDPVVVAKSPNKPNIRYSVIRVSRELEKSFGWLIDQLKVNRCSLDRVIVFCRSISTCTNLYKLFISVLKEESYHPLGSPPTTETRLLAMFHARIDDNDKKAILKSLVATEGTCRVVFCTIAFGMGVDVPNVRTIIHYGPSTDVDDYFQESGRAGRDGKPSEAIIFQYPGCLLGHVTNKMKEYCKLSTDKCRRVELLRHFPSSATDHIDTAAPQHICCDNCTLTCGCGDEPRSIYSPSDQPHTHKGETRYVSTEQRMQIREQILAFRQEVLKPALVTDTDDGIPIDTKLESVLASSVIDCIVVNCEYIFNVEELEEMCGMWNFYSVDIMRIIDETLD